ncbi:unnamed protein product [Diatraea saccharalis]|uniref:Uncharacterized protein n=1 Tax=Diatraea saccharalis TaxID=40085 RepID=A0A9N9R6S9_9NEOP|nr:unnamed protein product [Diatraea saccharalis]
MKNMLSAQLVQGKTWHAPLRTTTSAGSSNDFLFSSLGIGVLPGRAKQAKAGEEKTDDKSAEDKKEDAAKKKDEAANSLPLQRRKMLAPKRPYHRAFKLYEYSEVSCKTMRRSRFKVSAGHTGARRRSPTLHASHAHPQLPLELETTGWLKLGGSYIDINWRLLTYWETLFGYIAPKTMDSLKKDVDDGLTITKHNRERINESKYVGDIIQETELYLREEWHRPDKIPTIKKWVASGVWMCGKAGTGNVTE